MNADRRTRSVLMPILLGLVATMALSLTSRAEEGEAPSPRPTMQSIFQEMKRLIPLSLDEDRWSDPSSQKIVMQGLDRLGRAATTLERHGRDREAGFDELALNLGRDLREAEERYRIGAYDEARFFFTGSLQSCVACHVRLPEDRTFAFSRELTNQIEIQALDPRDRAWLYVTVRRFGDALDAWEVLLADPQAAPDQLDAAGVLVDYLNVALRVRGDVDRASRTLKRFGARKDLPVYLARRVEAWRKGLEGLSAKKFDTKGKPSLELGESLAREASQVAQGPFGRDGLVQDLAAASELVRWLEADRARTRTETRNPTDAERRARARAYYWLATVEARSLDGFWMNLSERHFEAAIRSDPKGPLAEPAYARLEETQVLGFGGASGDYLPADVWTNLRDLRVLIGLE